MSESTFIPHRKEAMQTQFFEQLADLFEVDASSLTGEERLSDLPNWSSLLFVALLAMVDEEYEVTLAPNDVVDCENLRALSELIERQSAGNREAA